MKSLKFIAGLLALTIPLMVFAQTDRSFWDITEASRFFIPINFLKEKGLIDGYTDGAFHSERDVNRAEALAMILKVTHGVDVEEGSAKLKLKKPRNKKPFLDVSEEDWFYDIVKEGKRLGIVKGKDQGKQKGKYFRPNDTVNLAEALRMLFKSASIKPHLSEGTLPEGIPADAWYAPDIAYAVKNTILTQKQNGAIFPPHETLNRGEMALLLYRFLKMKEGASFGYASWYGDGLAKTKLTENKEYAEKYMTAAHRSLPFGTVVHVTNMTNGKSVDVVINDRGPFVTGRIIDLSKSAFSALESPSAGIISVEIYAPSSTIP